MPFGLPVQRPEPDRGVRGRAGGPPPNTEFQRFLCALYPICVNFKGGALFNFRDMGKVFIFASRSLKFCWRCSVNIASNCANFSYTIYIALCITGSEPAISKALGLLFNIKFQSPMYSVFYVKSPSLHAGEIVMQGQSVEPCLMFALELHRASNVPHRVRVVNPAGDDVVELLSELPNGTDK